MAKLFKLHCEECDYFRSVLEGTTRSLVDEYFTVSCETCCSIENRNYHFPENRAVKPEPATGWWGRKKRQNELYDRYLEESEEWSAELVKRRSDALQNPCDQCGGEVQRVQFGDPYIESIPIDIGCPACKCHDCMKVTLESMID